MWKCLTDWSFFFAALANSDKSRLLWMKKFKLITFLQTQFHTKRHKMGKLTRILTYFLSIKRMHRRKDKTVIILSITSWYRTKVKHIALISSRLELIISLQQAIFWLKSIDYYLSAICGMMKCCPFLWSKTGGGHERATTIGKNTSSQMPCSSFAWCAYLPGLLPQR